MSGRELLRFSGASIAYDKTVVAGLDLTLSSGEIVALMGPSGSGKSTILRAAANQLKVASGEVRRANEGPSGTPSAAMMYQTPFTLPWMTATENVRAVSSSSREAAVTALRQIGLGEATEKFPHEMSGGMLKRLAIVMALCSGFELVLLDEPMAGLDDWSKELAYSAILEGMSRPHRTTVFTTHSVVDAAAIAHRVIAIGGAPARVLFETSIHLTSAAEPVDEQLRMAEAARLSAAYREAVSR